MSINKNGYWEGTEANEQHLHDPELANYLVDFFKNETLRNGFISNNLTKKEHFEIIKSCKL